MSTLGEQRVARPRAGVRPGRPVERGEAAQAAAARLKVRVLGRFAVCRAGRVYTTTAVGSRKARTLLAVLALHREYVSVDRITAALWADVPPRNPAANIATLVSRLRSEFGTSIIAGAAAGYRLGGGVRVDLFDAAELVNEAEPRVVGQQPAMALRAAKRAVELLDRDGVLTDQPEARWADPARRLHIDLLRRARHAAADAALRTGDFRTARLAAEAAVTADAFDEAACRMLMLAHHAAGESARALIAYQQLRAILAAELGVDPALATRNLHTAILQTTVDKNGHSVPAEQNPGRSEGAQ